MKYCQNIILLTDVTHSLISEGWLKVKGKSKEGL